MIFELNFQIRIDITIFFNKKLLFHVMIKNISPHFYAFILTLLQDAFTLNFDFYLIIQVFR